MSEQLLSLTIPKISAPGRYHLSMEQYHGDCCAGPSVSATVLHRLLSECPAKVWETSALNPHRVPEVSKPDFNIGRACHALVLGEPEFNRYFIISPYDEFRTKEARAWRDEQTRTVVKAELFETILAMADAQRRSPQVARAFADGEPEQSLIWLDAETGIYVKSRPDWLPHAPERRPVVDDKTCRSIEPRKMGIDVFSYGYHVQAALIIDGVRAVLGVDPMGVAHVCQEKAAPYLAELRMFDVEQIDYGRREYRRALRLFAECWERHLAGKPMRTAWPGFTTEPRFFDTPYYIAIKMQETLDGPNTVSSENLARAATDFIASASSDD